MRFLKLLKSSEPSSSATVREALAEATQAALAAGRRVEDLVEQRRRALLDDEADLDAIERQLQLAQRDADRADLAAAELKERLAAAEQAEQQAVRDKAYDQAEQARLRAVELITRTYPLQAARLKVMADELLVLEVTITEANRKLEAAGDPRRVADLERSARPKRETWGGLTPGRFVDQLRLPSAEDAGRLLWPHIDAWGMSMPESQRVSR